MLDDRTATTARPTILVSDPGALHAERAGDIAAAVAGVLRGERYVLGPEVEAFEHDFAARFGFRSAIGVANGTDGLELALRAVGLPEGGRVAVPALTAAATAAAVVRAGYEPAFVDIEPMSFNLDARALGRACVAALSGRRIVAVVPVHLYGRPCDMAGVMAAAREHSLEVIEDCSQSHGATIDGRPVGTFGRVAAFSCYPTKNLGALGDAGVVGTLETGIAERVRLLRQYGWRQRQVSVEVGMNSRLDDLQAAILRVQLRHLDADNARRERIASRYETGLAASMSGGIRLPDRIPGHVHHQYTIRCIDEGVGGASRRDRLAGHLAREGIMSAVLYPVPLHLQPAYAPFQDPVFAPCTVAEKTCRDLLCLPMHPSLTDEAIDRVIEAVRSFPGTPA